jgi:DNA gyrase subunit B
MNASGGQADSHYYKEGVEEFVKQLNKSKDVLHPKPIRIHKEVKVETNEKEVEVQVDVVLQYNDSYNDQVLVTQIPSTIRMGAHT